MENITALVKNCSQIADLDNPDYNNISFLPAEILQLKIQCQLQALSTDLAPFIALVQGLLNYGTTVVVCVGLTLNLVSLIVLTRKPMCQSSVNTFLSVLAVYDSLSLTLNFMIGVIRAQNLEANQSFMDSQSLCKLHGFFVVVFNLLSVWTIVAFTIVRCLIVKYPMKAKNFTHRRTLVIIAFVSLCVFIFSCHKIFITGFEGDSVFGYKGCKTNRATVPGIGPFYVACNTWLPVLLTILFNLNIIRNIKIQQSQRMTMTVMTSNLDRKATKLLLTVSFAYLVLVTPFGIVQTIELFWNDVIKTTPTTDPLYVSYCVIKLKLKWIRAFFFFFYQLNSAINFFLYVFSSSGTLFRKTLRRLLGMKSKDIAEVQRVWRISVKPNAVQPLPRCDTYT